MDAAVGGVDATLHLVVVPALHLAALVRGRSEVAQERVSR